MKNKPAIIFLIIPLLIIFIIKMISILDIKHDFTTPDLKNRIVGSRILKHKESESPYFYKWKIQDDERFLDPYDTPDLPMNRNTVTPFTLQLLKSVCDVKYAKLTYLWYIIELCSFFATLTFFLVLAKQPETKFYLALLFLVLGVSQIWTLHLLSGQIYILFPLLLAAIFFFGQTQSPLHSIFTGLLLGALILLRPTTTIFILPFAFFLNKKILLSTIASISIYIVITLAFHNENVWKEYFEAMSVWSTKTFKSSTTNDYLTLHNLKLVEGAKNLSLPVNLVLLEDSSIQTFCYRFLKIRLSKIHLSGILLFLWAVMFLLFHSRFRKMNLTHLFIFTFILYFLADLCIPAIRNSYNGVQWIFPLSLVLIERIILNRVIIIITCSLLFSLGFVKFFPFDLFVAELLFLFACITHLFKSTNYHA